MKRPRPAPHRGRPRAFDVDRALDRALKVFWRKGYEGTALPDLTRAMGINRPSLYAAFGNKEALFRKVLDRYAQGPASYIQEALNEPAALAVAERLLRETIDMLTDRRNPRGCLVVQGALACGAAGESVRKELGRRREAAVTALRRRLVRARSKGDLPAHASPADLARYLATMLHGLCVQAASGATRSQLQRVARTALRAWPR